MRSAFSADVHRCAEKEPVHCGFGSLLANNYDIGLGFYIGHFGAIRVRSCRIGANCSIAHSTDITPAANGPGPLIGDCVWIGAHARIVGHYQIGCGATVAAGAIVRHNVPDAVLYLGNPAHVVMRNYNNRSIL